MANYTRLTALDRSFLDIEDRSVHMHVGATCIFEAGPLRTADGGIDIRRIRDFVRSRLHRIPRYRQRLAWVPLENHPVWVDDDQFNLNYHVRHTCLPRPGDERCLKRLSGRIFSQQLDRGKPLWEMWIVEGLDGDRFATINKIHHCMIDGMAGADLLGVLLTPEPDERIGEIHGWHPRKAPDGAELLRDAALRRVTVPLRSVADAGLRAIQDPKRSVEGLGTTALALRDTAVGLFQTASASPLNDAIGAHRRFDWVQTPLEQLRAVKNRTGTKLNDVVLAVVCGAVDRFFEHRGFRPYEEEGFRFRIFCPVGLSAAAGGRRMGNQVSAMTIDAALGVDSPLRRLEVIKERTGEAKRSHMTEGLQLIEEFADWAAPSLMGTLDDLAARAMSFNMVCTNVPGPGFPLYMLGARMLDGFPLVPLFKNQGIGIALLSYDGDLHWGLCADREALPDLHDFKRCIEQSFTDMLEAVGIHPEQAPARAQASPPPVADPAAGDTEDAEAPDPTSPTSLH
jgi:diacylglycerol O-acyltransferase